MKRLLKFIAAFMILTIILTVAWDAIFPGRVYLCTDSVPFDYISPGEWIHGSFETVDSISSLRARGMEDPDAIIKGWTLGRLWAIWGGLFAASILLSGVIAYVNWGLSGTGLSSGAQRAEQ